MTVFRLLLALTLTGTITACSVTTPGAAGAVSLSNEPLLGKFVWHDLVTDDPAAARRFYGSLLGWEFEQTTHPRGGDYTHDFWSAKKANYLDTFFLTREPERVC